MTVAFGLIVDRIAVRKRYAVPSAGFMLTALGFVERSAVGSVCGRTSENQKYKNQSFHAASKLRITSSPVTPVPAPSTSTEIESPVATSS